MRYRLNTIIGFNKNVEAICVCCSPPPAEHSRSAIFEETLCQICQKIPLFERLVGLCVRGKIRTFTGKKVNGPGRLVREVMVCDGFNKDTVRLVSVQTRNKNPGKSSIKIVQTACKQLVEYADAENLSKIYVPALGTGVGGLSKELVVPLMKSILDDRFVLVLKPLGIRRPWEGTKGTKNTLNHILDEISPEYQNEDG